MIRKFYTFYEQPSCIELKADAELVFCDPSMSEEFEEDDDYDDWDDD